MYYFIYGLLYLFSLLPFAVIYFISDGVYALMYYVVGYRKKVVMNNLLVAFPEKTNAQRKKIAKQFYHNLADTFMEIIKLISMNDKTFDKRNIGDLSVIDELAKKGLNIQIHAAHQFNWEYGNLIMSKNSTAIPSYAIYMPITNKVMEKLFLKIRTRYGTQFVKATEFSKDREKIFSGRFILFLAADQNPGKPQTAYWQNLFGKSTAFISGPEIGARKNNTAIIYVRSRRIKRGFYEFTSSVLTENAAETNIGEITRDLRNYLEKIIKEEPDNYLWTHRRWKWGYKKEYADKWIDDKASVPE